METLKERRDRLGITQKELAETCGCHPTTISHIERERELPSLMLFARMAEELKVSPTKLLELLNVRAVRATGLQKARERRASR